MGLEESKSEWIPIPIGWRGGRAARDERRLARAPANLGGHRHGPEPRGRASAADARFVSSLFEA